jgi:SAM-dependent methyltransferase
MKSQERIKQTGEVFTPPELVNEMLDKLPEDQWTDPSKTFIDPACGNGNFLVEVIRRKIEAGAQPLHALMTTYGVDIMPDNITECQQKLVRVAYELSGADSIPVTFSLAVRRNIKLGHTLSFEIDDIFDKKPSKELRQWREQQIKEINS